MRRGLALSFAPETPLVQELATNACLAATDIAKKDLLFASIVKLGGTTTWTRMFVNLALQVQRPTQALSHWRVVLVVRLGILVSEEQDFADLVLRGPTHQEVVRFVRRVKRAILAELRQRRV